MSAGDKNSRSQQLPQKPDHSYERYHSNRDSWLPPVQRLDMIELAIFSKHLIVLLVTDSATNKSNLQL